MHIGTPLGRLGAFLGCSEWFSPVWADLARFGPFQAILGVSGGLRRFFRANFDVRGSRAV